MSLFFRQCWGWAEGARSGKDRRAWFGGKWKTSAVGFPRGIDTPGRRVLKLFSLFLFFPQNFSPVQRAGLPARGEGICSRYPSKPNPVWLRGQVEKGRGCSVPAPPTSCL